MAEAKRVLIRGKGGEEYSVTEAGFRAGDEASPSYADQGFKIVSYEDGSEYGGKASKAEEK